jgi:hypothetical protein
MSRLPIATLALVALALPASAYSGGYVYRRAITVASAVVPSTQVNFPMLVYGTYSYLATLPNGGMVHNTATLNSQTVPVDLIFTSDAAGTTLLNWEVASYTPTTGKIEAWVQVPSLSNGTVIYMFYSNLSVSTYQGSAVSTWGASYAGIWHMANGTTQSLVDSSGSGNGLGANGTTAISGQIDGASANSGAAPNGLRVTSPTGLYGLTSWTLSGWVNATSLSNSPVFEFIGYNGASINSSGTLSVSVATNSTYRRATSTTTISTGTWVYLTFTYASATAPHIYINGAEVTYASQTAGSGTDTTPSGGVGLGVNGASFYTGTLTGALDEMRIASVARPANWITTEYNNQSNPSAFYAIGAVTSMAASTGVGMAIIIM